MVGLFGTQRDLQSDAAFSQLSYLQCRFPDLAQMINLSLVVAYETFDENAMMLVDSLEDHGAFIFLCFFEAFIEHHCMCLLHDENESMPAPRITILLGGSRSEDALRPECYWRQSV